MTTAPAKEALLDRVERLTRAEVDLGEVCSEVVAAVVAAIPTDAWCWSITDPATLMITASTTHGLPLSIGAEFFRIELTEPDQLKLAILPPYSEHLFDVTPYDEIFLGSQHCSTNRAQGLSPPIWRRTHEVGTGIRRLESSRQGASHHHRPASSGRRSG